MAADADHLRKLYVDVTGQESVVERREEEPSRDPIGEAEAALEAEVSSVALEDGLDDAVEGSDASASA